MPRLPNCRTYNRLSPYGAWIEIVYKKCGLFQPEQYRIFAIKTALLFVPVRVAVPEVSYNKVPLFQKTFRSV